MRDPFEKYLIPAEKAEKLAALAVYVFDDRNERVATHGGWERYRINEWGHRVQEYSYTKPSPWFKFSTSEVAEKFVTSTLKRDLEDFSFQYVDQEAVKAIMGQ